MKNKKSYIFAAVLIGMTAIFWLVALITRGATLNLYFVPDSNNTYMDYFHMLSNIEGVDPYYQNANYPALPFVIWRVLYRMIPWSESNSDGFYLRTNMYADLGFILMLLLCIIIMWEAFQYYFQLTTKNFRLLFSFSILFSGVMLFTIERGNIILLSFLFSLIYIILFDSDNKLYRYIAYVCLALSAAIKLYPAVFGILVLYKKRYKEGIYLLILGVMFFILPFFVFDGIHSLEAMVKGFSVSSSEVLNWGYGYNFSFFNLIRIFFGIKGTYISSLPGKIMILPILLCCGIYLMNDTLWKKLFALTLLIIWIPTFSYTYTLLFLILPLIFFLKDQNKCGDIFYSICFALLLAPWCLPKMYSINYLCGEEFKFYLTYGMLICNALILLMGIVLFLTGVKSKINYKNSFGKIERK